MSARSESPADAQSLRDKIIGLGERSLRKSYYPELQQRLDELEQSHRSLEEKSATLERMVEDLEEARARLASSEHRQKLALQISHIGAFEADLETGRGEWTPDVDTIWGLPEGFAGDFVAFCWDHVHPDDVTRVTERFAAAAESGEPVRMEFRIVRPDDEVRWLVWHGQVMGGPDSGSQRVIGVNVDVTEQRVAEAAVAGAAAEWRATFDAMHDSVALLDPDGRVVRCNAAATELTGRSYDEIVGRPCYTVFHGGDTWRAACPQTAARASRRSETAVFEQGGHWLRATFHPLLDDDRRLTGGVHVISDITELKQTEHELQRSLERLTGVTEQMIAALAGIVEARDPYTAGHQRRVSELATAIAERVGLADDTVAGMRVAALLHDIGKITIPAEILTKPGRLTDVEFAIIKIHPQAAYDVLHGIELPWPVALMALQHHERLDGSGYPRGLRSREIIPEARILAVADVVEAMSSHRPYRAACGTEAALDEIDAHRQSFYDGDTVDACVAVFAEDGFAFATPT